MVSLADSGHPAGSLSSTEMYLAVYGVADLTPKNCSDVDRDYVSISHGHTSPGAYAALAEWGFFSSMDAVAHFRQCGSPFQGHVERDVPGIDWGSGNLGQGLSAGVGFALAQKARKNGRRTYVLMGDGGQTKGQSAEARRIAVKENLTNLTALVDWNNIQISGTLESVMPADIPALWRADGWNVLECDGHSFRELYAALRLGTSGDRPTVILCRTVMGRGVSFMENTPVTPLFSTKRGNSAGRHRSPQEGTWRPRRRTSTRENPSPTELTRRRTTVPPSARPSPT
jgi:transketolase